MTSTPSDPRVDAVLGLMSAAKLSQFASLARIAARAPDIESRVAMARRAAIQMERVARLGELLAERERDQMVAIARFIGPLDQFDNALDPADWWEALVMGYVEQGVASDLEGALIEGLGQPWIDTLAGVRATGRSRRKVEALVGSTAASDERWKSRLSLWGRRVVGEALSAVQRLMTAEPELAQLVTDYAGGDPTRLHLVLSANHATRMAKLGLTA